MHLSGKKERVKQTKENKSKHGTSVWPTGTVMVSVQASGPLGAQPHDEVGLERINRSNVTEEVQTRAGLRLLTVQIFLNLTLLLAPSDLGNIMSTNPSSRGILRWTWQ